MLQLEVIRSEKSRIVNGLRKRNWSTDQLKVINEIIALDDQRKSTQKEVDDARAEMNQLAKSIGQLMAQGKKDEAELQKKVVSNLKENEKQLDEKLSAIKHELEQLLYTVPNCPTNRYPKGPHQMTTGCSKHGINHSQRSLQMPCRIGTWLKSTTFLTLNSVSN